jgi:hypothetical protein
LQVRQSRPKILALSRLAIESNEREQVEPRDVFGASVLVNYFKAHIRRVFVELHGKGSENALAAVLKALLEEQGGSWEGTATELREALAEKEVEGLAHRPEELSKQVRAIGSRSKALVMKNGWRRVEGKPQRFLQFSLKNAVDPVDAVDGKAVGVNSVNSVNRDSEEDRPDEEEIVKLPDRTAPLSPGDEWEEV